MIGEVSVAFHFILPSLILLSRLMHWLSKVLFLLFSNMWLGLNGCWIFSNLLGEEVASSKLQLVLSTAPD